jgi:flagellar hook-length control protein FliK
MIPNALRDAIARVLATTPVPRIELEADVTRTPARSVGQLLQAQLVADLPNGRSLLDVQGFRFDVKLPVPARLGETFHLEVLALQPKLTFALLGAQAGAKPDAVSMSDSVRQLTALLDRVSSETSAAPTARAAPVLPAPPDRPADLAEALKNTLARSGLFYESHQAQWIAGERPLEELMREPQAALKPTEEPVHPQATALVRQQLETLDTRQIVWTGQVWPDQSLEWRIEEEPQHDSSSAEAPTSWKTSLRLELPQLGAMRATLSIAGNDVRMTLSAAEVDARSALRAGEPALRAAFQRAGLTLLDVAVPDETTAGAHGPGGTRERGGFE